MPAEFDTREYEASHGQKPRGRGSWAFQVEDDILPVFSPSMTYTEAKRWVRQQNPDARYFKVGA
jgi:hypothetical protein